MRLGITGATGYIGQSVVREALQVGHSVIALTRERPSAEGVEWIHFDLTDESDLELPLVVDAVIHLAATTHISAIDPAVEVRAARRLREACRKVGARFIFISSQTAREDAPTAYGQSKWLIEAETRVEGGISIRPGQVYGAQEGALFGVLVDTVRRLPVIPAFIPAPKIQPVHVDDLAHAIIEVAKSESMPPLLSIAAPVPMSFTSFLHLIASERLGSFKLTLPVPIFIIRVASNLLGARLRSKFGLDQLDSLFKLPGMQTDHDLRRLGITLRSVTHGMSLSRKPGRRALLEEGYILFVYLLREVPSLCLLRRYARCIDQLSDGEAIGLSKFYRRFPSTIALIDLPGISDISRENINWRLQVAITLSEASQQGAGRYLLLGRSQGFFLNGLKISSAILRELGWRVLRLLAGSMLHWIIPVKERN